jgi:hypothetical protein
MVREREFIKNDNRKKFNSFPFTTSFEGVNIGERSKRRRIFGKASIEQAEKYIK